MRGLPGRSSRSSGRPFTVRVSNARALDPDVVRAWSSLEARALEPNAYLSPHFVLPALRYLDPDVRALAIRVERAPESATDGHAGETAGEPAAARLVGMGIFEWVKGTRAFPLPHLVAYRSRHSFSSGILLDRAHAAEALAALVEHLASTQIWRGHGLELEGTWGDGPTFALIAQATAAHGGHVDHEEWNVHTRSVLEPFVDRARIEANLSAQGRDLRRRRRRLEEQGSVSWALHRRGGIRAPSVEAFLDLEHRGWKGETRTSLRSNPADEGFFREAVARFAGEERAVFTELLLDGEVIASTSNFVSGRAGFAFKIGWRPDLAKVSPGVLNEMEFLTRMYGEPSLGDLDFWDSGAAEGSYIDKLWPGRRPLVSMAIATTRLGRSVMSLVRAARAIRKRHRARQPVPASAATAPPEPRD